MGNGTQKIGVRRRITGSEVAATQARGLRVAALLAVSRSPGRTRRGKQELARARDPRPAEAQRTWRGAASGIAVAALAMTSVLGGALAVTATPAAAQPTAATIQVPGAAGVAFLPDGTRAYVSAQTINAVSVIDTASGTVIGSVPVGPEPFGLAVTPDGHSVYVANGGGGTVSVIDTATDTVTATIPVGDGPFSVKIAPNGTVAYVTNYYLGTVSVINTTTLAVVATVRAGTGPSSVAFGPSGNLAYVTNVFSDTVSVIDTATNAVTATVTVPSGSEPYYVAVTPDGKFGYVANFNSANVSIFDTGTNTLTTTVPAGAGASAVAITPDGRFVFVANQNAGTVTVITTATNVVLETLSPGQPIAVAVAPGGAFAYVADYSPNTVTVEPTPLAPTIVAGPSATLTLGAAGTVNVGASGVPTPSLSESGALPAGLTFVDDANGVATISGTPATGTVGSYPLTITATNGVTPDATQAFLLVVSKAAQAITFTSSPPPNASVGGTYTVAATGGPSGQPVVLSVDAASTSVCSIAGPQVSFNAAGTCVIDANEAGDADYAAAPPAQQSISVSKGAQAITFTSNPPANASVGGGYTVAATGGPSGQPVVLSVDAASTSVCSIAGAHVSFNAAGTCGIDANQAGTADYTSAPQAQQSISVSKAAQAITFTSSPPANAIVGGTYAVTATGGPSGQPVVISIDPASASICSLAGATVSFKGSGTCAIDANQAGNANYTAAAQAQQSITVSKAGQVIAFTSSPPANATVGGGYTVAATGGPSSQPVVLSVDALSASVCSIAGSHVTFTAAGTCVIDANQAGDANYVAAPQVSQTVSVAKGSQAITFTSSPPANAIVGGTYTVAATGGPSGQAVVFSIDPASAPICSTGGATVTFNHAGTCAIDANQAGNANYTAAAPAQQSVSVSKAAQTITFTSSPPANATVEGSYTEAATGGPSGQPVVFSIDPASASICSAAGATVTFNHAGSCAINANQAGNGDFVAAPQVTQTVSVAPAPTAITAGTATVSTNLLSKWVTMSATVTSKTTGTGISGLNVVFSLGDEASCTATTNINGVAHCAVVYGTLQLLTPIPSTYTATVAGTSDYITSTGTGTVAPSLLRL
jgi:large repetitive protein